MNAQDLGQVSSLAPFGNAAAIRQEAHREARHLILSVIELTAVQQR